jgi:hypothetical protein
MSSIQRTQLQSLQIAGTSDYQTIVVAKGKSVEKEGPKKGVTMINQYDDRLSLIQPVSLNLG